MSRIAVTPALPTICGGSVWGKGSNPQTSSLVKQLEKHWGKVLAMRE